MAVLHNLNLNSGQAEMELTELRTFMNDNTIFKEIVQKLKERITHPV
jgi:hypothetical protein